MRFRRLTWGREHTYGFLIGIATIAIAIPVVAFILSQATGVGSHIWTQIKHLPGKQAQVLSLAAIANLPWFHYFLKKERWGLGYGIIYVTILDLLMVVLLKFVL